MSPFSLRSLLLAAIVISNCITWTASRHHFTHNVLGHRSRHRRQGAGLFLSASYVLPGGEGAGWGEWGEISPCSRTCGGGVASQKRICLQLGPDGQPQCTGGDTKYFSCQTQDCPAGSKDFREEQCSEFDDVAFRDIKYKWVPYTQAPNPCELNCMPHGERFYYRHRTKVVDGTRCNDESFDVCVNGTCQTVGCDMMLGSTAREDKCRDCRGNGANCQTNVGVLDAQGLRKGYIDILLIPQGATSISIAERAPSINYLALRSTNDTYYLNGEYHIDFPRSLVIAGALWYYERSQQGFAAPDKLRCLGPTNEPLYLALLLQEENVGIDYEYSVPNELAPPKNKRYNWVHEEFTPCSAACGGGYQTRNVSCRSREELELVDESLCDHQIKPTTNQTCNTDPCAPQWTPGAWGKCSKRCGEGGITSREVHCTQIITNGYPSIVSDKSCFDLHGPKPELFQECNKNATCPLWFTGPWKPCDKLCDEGKQSRQVVCYQKNGHRIEVLGDKECEAEKPPTEQSCMLQLCDGVDWVLSEWSGCDTCLSTVRTRTVYCATKDKRVVNDSFCANHLATPPKKQEDCDKAKLPPCDVQWYATQWSKCSVDCGKGFQKREVFCGVYESDAVTRVDDSRCAGLPKYNDTKDCEIPQDKCPSQWFAGPWSACTKNCSGGEQFRTVMCLRGGEPANDCNFDLRLNDDQACNTHPCDKDELLPVDKMAAPVLDDYDDCEEDYAEVGLEEESAPATMEDFMSTMFSDSPTEGSGWGSSTAEHESTFSDIDSTLSSEEFFSTESGSGTSETDITGTSEDTTDTTWLTSSDATTDLTSDSSGSTEPTITEETGSTVSGETDITYSTDTEGTGSTVTEATDISSSSGSPLTEETSESEKTSGSEETGSTETDSSADTSVYDSTENTASEYTDSSTEGTSESKASSETWSTESEITSETDSTAESSTETTESGATDASTETSGSEDISKTEYSKTTETGTTEATETGGSTGISSTEPTETGSTEPTETGSTKPTETGSTEPTETGSTEPTETGSTEPTETGSTEPTETGSTEPTETGSTEPTETGSTEPTETGSTEPTETGSTEPTETGSTEPTETGSTEPTETGSTEPTETGSTEPTETGSTEPTVTVSTEPTEITETISTEVTETGSTESTETGSTEVTETGSTEPTETGSTEPTETSSTEPTETGSTEPTETGSTEVTETGSMEPTKTGSTEPTETGSTEPTETGSTEPTETGSTESTETGSTEVTEIGSTEQTETGSTEPTETGSTEPTETGSTEVTETGSTEPTETGSTEPTETTETGSTETPVTEETTEVSGSTLSSGGTESSTELPTTEASPGITRWDLSSTVEAFTTKRARVCRPRSCLHSKFGCCADKKTPALGPFEEGCEKLRSCKDTLYRCCPDGVSPAKGEGFIGCPKEPCAETLFGCCESDNSTAAQGNDQEGCPPPPPACVSSEFGCCKDGETEATGPGKEGCPETTTTIEDTEETGTSTSVSPTESIEGCAGTEYGCCFDNETAATGPEMQGCPCSTSEFGCCPDGVAAAQGPSFEGCVKSCNTSAYGCCSDGKTPAHGPGQEGCCLLHAYGCCPDNYKPADGPHLEGCGCQYSRFGCCPDNVTVATGPDNKGCGCQYTEHGCCPDRHTEASGPDFEGCMCHTYQFGCCPDGVTIARGPNGQGCYCQQSTYGCCGDEQTHAKGPNKEGCDCATSKHGCCPDGTTEATGPKFEGCTDKPENKQAACSLKFERGSCRNYSVNWFYDTEYGGCSRFWYGGCEGNGNRFASKEDCEDTCVQPPPKDACKLPQIKGACLGYNVRWFYDSNREMCTNFIYGGCLGNNNNFETRELCQAQCEPERTLDQCNLAIERGSCAGNYPRWGFNVESRRCEEFTWGGCEGNSNRFSTEAACLLRCNPPGEPQPECSETQDVGNCTDTEALWSFSQSENRCVPFYYTGCGGNGNKFTTKDECQLACPSSFVPELCTLPASTGDCSNYREKWYFDTKDQRCRQFYYGGCGGNDNKFDTEQQCINRCLPPAVTTPTPTVVTATQPRQDPERQEFCFLEIEPGICNEKLETKWAYDYTRGRCITFQFGGCGGNQNNFPSEEYCTYYCKPAQDICQLPMLEGPCEDSVMSWFYDAASDSCSQFTYGGCEGNENRFESREACEDRCKIGPAPSASTAIVTTTTARIDTHIGEDLPPECSISPTLEACSHEAVGEVWYYDPSSSVCTAHENLETGVECRTTGVFYSQEACERSCGVFRNIDVCRYPLDPGPCREVQPKYHYNETSRRCEEFAYGGCLGGPNRFSSEQECQQICMVNVDPCTLPAEPGNCLNRLVMWYYDQNRDSCYQFAYSGCGGNDNKFESRELCEGHCRKQVPLEVTTTTPVPVQITTRQPEISDECRTPSSLEPCGANVTAFYFDERTGQCGVADIGACRYSNSFRSEEECERRCGAFRGFDVCHTQLDPGPCRASIPKYYFDAASGSCKPYAYGGCQGGPNRFSTSAECEEVCAEAGPAPVCLEPVTTGERCGASPERRWHYDVTRADCLVFAYLGCGGSQNNFASYDECVYLCKVATPDTQESKKCDLYAEECISLEQSCDYGVRREVAPEGCERCVCEEIVSCEAQQQECDALRCQYGIERTAGEYGCVKCKCFDDPCSRSNCTSSERCVASAYRDPITQDVLYSAHCVPEIETNEVLPDCEAYVEECARMSCPFGVQRLRTRGGCERCACVQQEVDCAPLRTECERLKCHYGLARSTGEDGCERCKCLEHPCSGKTCPEGKRCVATPFRDPVTQEPRYSADCRTVNKPGVCPVDISNIVRSTEAACRQECSDDAECRGVLKCCARACSRLCLAPAAPTTPPVSTTHAPDVPHAPVASTETEPEITAAEGGKATLRCIFHGNPPPLITWRFGEITITGDLDRYRITSDGALEIVALHRNDSGVYVCVAENDLGTAQQEITLRVNDPVRTAAGIAGEEDAAVTGELSQPLAVRCLAYGYPPPEIFWYRGRGGAMVPFYTGVYEARGQELLIRQLSLDTLGEYECQAYNGKGKAATWRVTVQAWQPEGVHGQYLVPRQPAIVAVTPRPAPTTTPALMFTIPPYTAPVTTRLALTSTTFSAGTQISLPCEVDGYPDPEIRWTKDGVPLASSDRMWITGPRLTILRAAVSDSGTYTCSATNAYSSHASTVQITVQEMYIPAKCVDNPTFANCALIVQSRFCLHKYYSRFCCKSCVEAGQLDPRDVEMQADQPFRKK